MVLRNLLFYTEPMTQKRGSSSRRIRKSSIDSKSSRTRSASNAAVTSSQHRASQSAMTSPNLKTFKQRSIKQLKHGIVVAALFSQKYLKGWRGLVALSMVLTGSISLFSIAFLFKLPAVPNCPSIFWPLASASLRLHCAEIAANKRTVKDLLEGIQLVNSLPPDHPLYEEAKRMITLWSRDILDLGEEAFQAGKLDEAIDIAKKVPRKVIANDEVEGKIKRWQEIWAAAEKIYQQSEDALRNQNWRQASTQAARLLSIENNFWQTTKYQELTQKITIAREEINKVMKAKRLIDNGGLKNLQEAIQLASSINDQSYVYQEAQATIVKAGQKMLDLAEAQLDRRNLSEALNIVRQIPQVAKLQLEAEDFEQIANAMAKTWSGLPEDFDAAIAQARSIGSNRPLYGKAQGLIARWQIEKGDVAQLNQARQLAQSGRPEDIQAAISAASQIAANNPRASEARTFVSELTTQVQTQQDRPIIDRAEQLASSGDVSGLQAAIDTLSQITPGRALSQEANRKRQEYRQQLRQLQTPSTPEPTLDTQVTDRAQAEESLRSARETANQGTVDALVDAIGRANAVAVASPFRREAQQMMDMWSQQILQTALSQAATDMSGAIATAQKIPPGTEAHAQAQLQIQAWQRQLGQ